MAKVILNKQDIMNILSWAGQVRNLAIEVNIPFEEDEFKTLQKIKHHLK